MSGNDWKRFTAGTTPSTLDIDTLFFESVEPGARVLDIGCGTGKTTRNVGAQGYVVTGIDINEDEVALAQRMDHGKSVRYVAGDAAALPFDDRSFDACIMQAFLTTLAEPRMRRKAVAEAHRVLVAGGILYLGVFAYTPENPAYKRRYDAHLPITGEQGTFIVTAGGKKEGKPLYRAHHYTRDELEALLEGLFAVERVKDAVVHSYHGNWCNAFVVIARKLE